MTLYHWLGIYMAGALFFSYWTGMGSRSSPSVNGATLFSVVLLIVFWPFTAVVLPFIWLFDLGRGK